MRARLAARPWRWNPLGACIAGDALRSTRVLQKLRRRLWSTQMVRPPPTPLLDGLRSLQVSIVLRSQVSSSHLSVWFPPHGDSQAQ